MVIDDHDAHLADDVRALGMDVVVTDTVMGGAEGRERLARTLLSGPARG